MAMFLRLKIIFLRACNSKTKKKFENPKGEGEDIQVRYNSSSQELSYSDFLDHNVGLLVFYLPPRRQLTHRLKPMNL